MTASDRASDEPPDEPSDSAGGGQVPVDAQHAPPRARSFLGRVPLDQVGEHPDYRFTLANERTFLAWIRTALALVAGGIAVVQLVPEFSFFPGGRHILGVLLILLAIVVSGSSYLRWERNERALRLNEPLPRSRLPWLIAAGLVLITALSLVLVVFSRGWPK